MTCGHLSMIKGTNNGYGWQWKPKIEKEIIGVQIRDRSEASALAL